MMFADDFSKNIAAGKHTLGEYPRVVTDAGSSTTNKDLWMHPSPSALMRRSPSTRSRGKNFKHTEL